LRAVLYRVYGREEIRILALVKRVIIRKIILVRMKKVVHLHSQSKKGLPQQVFFR
jgi:hypothetical protein